jgi:hypothetical protein
LFNRFLEEYIVKKEKMIAVLIGLMISPLSFGGALLVYGTKNGDIRLYSEADKVMMESSTKEGKQSLIFDNAKPGVLMIDHGTKKFTHLDPEKINNMMKEAMKGVPPEQRKMMEEMMKGGMKGAAAGGAKGTAKKIEYKFVKNETINKFATKLHDVLINGKKDQQIWFADFSEVKVSLSDLKGYEKFALRMKNIIESMPMMSEMVPEEVFSDPKLGIAVKIKENDGEVVLKEAKSETYKAAQFAVPTGYTESKLEMEN